MFRISLLQNWYNLSDRDMEEMLYDRISFKNFIGLDIGHKIHDHSTICKFRNALNDRSIQNKLLWIVNEYLENKGMIVKKCTIEDATIIKSPMNKNNNGKEWIDKDAGSKNERRTMV